MAAEVAATRSAACLFRLADPAHARGVIDVTGADAPRWLDGMVSNETVSLAPGQGCYATLLTPKGRIVADLHVLARDDGYWLDTSVRAIPEILERLGRYVVADDVTLVDRSPEIVRLALEGPDATRVLGASEDVPAESWVVVDLGGVEVPAARFGATGETGWQLFVPKGREEGVVSTLGVPVASDEAFEVLRIEAGSPLLGAELDDEVFPDEARLGSAVSRTKGCYTGQEIVARLHSRGAVNHLLVGLRFEGRRAPEPGAELHAGERRTGEVTSACVSPSLGPVGLGFVRVEHAEPGTALSCRGAGGALAATVSRLPLLAG